MSVVTLFGSDVPYMYSGVINYAMKPFQRTLTTTMSDKTNALYKAHAVHAMDDPYAQGLSQATSSQAHGINSVTDTQHLTRMQSAVSGIESALSNHLGVMYDVLQFISDYTDNMTVSKATIGLDTEGKRISVDRLKQKVDAVTKTITNEQMLVG